ncbi:MAG: hypothetical protein KC636_40125, partial [Myxococcales bacterium]|nr:hypothetical protein [Myxococcales bacterium]
MVALIALLSALLGWMLLLNMAVWTGLIAWAASGEHRMSTVDVAYESGWALWPTRVHVRDLRLRIDGYRYQLELTVPAGTVDVSLPELLSRRFHARRITGEGVRAIVRTKAREGARSAAREEAFGSIAGLDAPVLDAEPPNLPPLDEAWEVEIDALDAHVVELWVNELHFEDLDARASGGLRAQVGHFFAVDGARLSLRDGTLVIAGEPLADGLSGEVTGDIDGFDPYGEEGTTALEELSSEVQLDAHVLSLAALEPVLPSDGPVWLAGGAGSLSVRAGVDDGALTPGSGIDYKTRALRVRGSELRGRARAHGSLTVSGASASPRARLALTLERVRVHAGESDDGEAAIVAET